MNVTVNREELQEIASGKVPQRLQDAASKMLADLGSQLVLGDLWPVGLADNQAEDIVERFSAWERDGTPVYASETAAREDRPRVFREVCTEWGRAGYIHRSYRLKDGRTVIAQGCWWSVPEPGGNSVVFYLS